MSAKSEVTVAALSVALSTALQISGLGGPLVSVGAWLVVAVLVVYLLSQHLRSGKGMTSIVDLAHRTRQLGHDLVDFGRSRKASAPAKRRLWIGSTNSKREYEKDTMSIFVERFGKPLHEVVDELRGCGLVGIAEAMALKAPQSPGAIERVGKRLIQLASQMWSP